MIDFDPNELFPLFDPASHTYRDAQVHSAKVDEHLGFQIEKIEAQIEKHFDPPAGSQPWICLPHQVLQTPYSEIRYLLSLLDPAPGETLVDLGAGYGRMGLVLSRHYPEVRFLGFEFIPDRVIEGTRILKIHACSPLIHLEIRDLSQPEFTLPEAEIYFMYDFGSREAIEKALSDLRNIARTRRIRVVGRGRASRDAIEREHPWLSQVVKPHHSEHFSIYSSQ